MATVEPGPALPSHLQLSIAKYERCLMKLRQDDLQEKLLLATYNLELTQAKRIRDNLKSVLRVWRAKQLEVREENQNNTVVSSTESIKEDPKPNEADACKTTADIFKNNVAYGNLTEEEALEPVQCQHITGPIVNCKDSILEKLERQQLAFIEQQEEICKQISACQENLKVLMSRENELERKEWRHKACFRSAGTQSSHLNTCTPKSTASSGSKRSGPLSTIKRRHSSLVTNGTSPFDTSLPLSLHAGDQQFSPLSEREVDSGQGTPIRSSSVLSLVANLDCSDNVLSNMEVSEERSYNPLLSSERIASVKVCDHREPIAGVERSIASSLSVKSDAVTDRLAIKSESEGKLKGLRTDQWQEKETVMPQMDHEISKSEQTDIRDENEGTSGDNGTDSKMWKNQMTNSVASQEVVSKTTAIDKKEEEICDSQVGSGGNQPSCEGKIERSRIKRTQEDPQPLHVKGVREDTQVSPQNVDQEQVTLVHTNDESNEVHDPHTDDKTNLVIKTKRKRRRRICYRSPVKKKSYLDLRNFADPEEPLVEVSFCYKKMPYGNVVPGGALAQSVVAPKQDNTLCKRMAFTEATLLAGDASSFPVDILTVSPIKKRGGKKAEGARKGQERQKNCVQKEAKSKGSRTRDLDGLKKGNYLATSASESNRSSNPGLGVLKNRRTCLSSNPGPKGNNSGTPINKTRLANTAKGASRSKKGDVATSLSSASRHDVKTSLARTRSSISHSPCFNDLSKRRMATAKSLVANGSKSASKNDARRTSNTGASCTVRCSFAKEVAKCTDEEGKETNLCSKASHQAEYKGGLTKNVQKTGGGNDLEADCRSERSVSKVRKPRVADSNTSARNAVLVEKEKSKVHENAIHKEAEATGAENNGNITEKGDTSAAEKRRGNKGRAKSVQISGSPSVTRKTGPKGKTNVERSPKASKPQTKTNNKARRQPTRSAKKLAQKKLFYKEDTVDDKGETLPVPVVDDDATLNLISGVSLHKGTSPSTSSSSEMDHKNLNLVLMSLENIPEEEASLCDYNNGVQVKEMSAHPPLLVSPYSKQLVEGLVDVLDKERDHPKNGKVMSSVACEIKGQEASVRLIEKEVLGVGNTGQARSSSSRGVEYPEPDQGITTTSAESNGKDGGHHDRRIKGANQERNGLCRSRAKTGIGIALNKSMAGDMTLNTEIAVQLAPTPCMQAQPDSRRITRSVARQRARELEEQQHAHPSQQKQALSMNISVSSIQDSSVFIPRAPLSPSAEETSKSILCRRRMQERKEADSSSLKTEKARPQGMGETERNKVGTKAEGGRGRTGKVTKKVAQRNESAVLRSSTKTAQSRKRLSSAPSHAANEGREDSPCCPDFKPKRGRQTSSSTSTFIQRQSSRLRKQAASCLENKLHNDGSLLFVPTEGSAVTDVGQRLNLKARKGPKGKNCNSNKDETVSQSNQELSPIDAMELASTKPLKPRRQRSVTRKMEDKRDNLQEPQGLPVERDELNNVDIKGQRSNDFTKLPSSCEDMPAEAGVVVMTASEADSSFGEVHNIKTTSIIDRDAQSSTDNLLDGEARQNLKTIECNEPEKEEAEACSSLKVLEGQRSLKEGKDKETHIGRSLRKRTKGASSQKEASLAPSRADTTQASGNFGNNTFAKKKRKTLFNPRERSLMTSGFLALQDTMNGTTALGNRTNTSSMPPSLAKFLKSFVAPKLKQSSSRSSSARCSKANSNASQEAKS